MNQYAPIKSIIEDIAAGKMVILVDDPGRENEGDLICAADFATPEAINFMITEGRGLVCVSLTTEQVKQLELPQMTSHNDSIYSTPFTVSIEARHGVTTGISVFDRAVTIQAAIAADAKPQDVVVPGHVFPLRCHPEGVLGRPGHTEASCDLAALAGAKPAGVMCEILAPDGNLLRGDALFAFANEHQLKIGTIADLITYRQEQAMIVAAAKGSEHEQISLY